MKIAVTSIDEQAASGDKVLGTVAAFCALGMPRHVAVAQVVRVLESTGTVSSDQITAWMAARDQRDTKDHPQDQARLVGRWEVINAKATYRQLDGPVGVSD